MFAACLDDLARRAKRCIVECDPRLAALLARSFPEIRIVPRDLAGYPADVHAALGDLPEHFRRGWRDFPRYAGYLRADGTLVAAWRRRLVGLPHPLIAVSWRGGKDPDWRRRRSTRLMEWLPVLRTSGA
jgi:hypothetical protein